VRGAAARVLAALQPSAQDLFPEAERALAAGRGVEAAAALPVYLREHTAWRRGS
jgi:tRNA A37 threonylcarbamoyladenosine modification protein TsaB